MKARVWRASKDPLYRGDEKDGVRLPAPAADSSIVRHILYLEGPGRETPGRRGGNRGQHLSQEMILQSCQNCWFNGLQYGRLGLATGYCTRHRAILNQSEATTCGQQLRKDLGLNRAREVNAVHRQHFNVDVISLVDGGAMANGEISQNEDDLETLRTDRVGEAVADYGDLDSKIESLAHLRALPGARAETAMLCLARSYVLNCMERNGSWTSGIHLLWWTKQRLAKEPEIGVSDIRRVDGVQLARQVALTSWSIFMLRLTLIDDIAEHAKRDAHPIAKIRNLASQCAEQVQTFNPKRLSMWAIRVALPMIDEVIPKNEYRSIARQLHVEPAGP